MRHSVLNNVLEAAAENSKHHDRVQLFEIGNIYLPNENGQGEDAILPTEPRRLAIVLTGLRTDVSWLAAEIGVVDFFDLKGIIEALLEGLHLSDVAFKPTQHHAYHPGRVAEVVVNGRSVGIFGQLHPLVVEVYEVQADDDQPVVVADFDLDALLAQVPTGHVVREVPRFPPVQQDIAVVVDESVPAAQVEALITQTGQPLLTAIRLFDVYRGDQLGQGKKSLAYSLTFQAEDRTLTDKAVAKQQQKIVQRLTKELGAKLRG